ncbi:MAG: KilA-N domain-containing protein [Marmoricola sp.]
MSYPFQSAPADHALSPVSVCGIEVNRDPGGRFSLNDLHRASGGEDRHRPSYWLHLDQTKGLIEEIRKPLNCSVAGIPLTERINDLEPVVTLRGFGAQGTFVVRELVYGYAMWISPAFHLAVIRTFDALVTGQPWSPPGRGQAELFGPVIDPAKLASAFGQFLRLGKLGGLDTEAARQVADRETRRLLGVSPLAVLGMTPLAPISAPAPANEPSYTVVEPEPGPEVLPLTELLHRRGEVLTAREVHTALERLHLLERRTLEVAGRPSRIYPVLIGEGLRYGANVRAKASYLTTHPMYYPGLFSELLARITEARVVESAVDPQALAGKTTDQMSKRQREVYKAAGLAEARKVQKRLDQRVARQEAALAALAQGELWSRITARLNLDNYFTTEERGLLRRGLPPIEILDPGEPGELPASLVAQPGADLMPFDEWLKTRH